MDNDFIQKVVISTFVFIAIIVVSMNIGSDITSAFGVFIPAFIMYITFSYFGIKPLSIGLLVFGISFLVKGKEYLTSIAYNNNSSKSGILSRLSAQAEIDKMIFPPEAWYTSQYFYIGIIIIAFVAAVVAYKSDQW